jgi:carboxyl-terminal processing protease
MRGKPNTEVKLTVLRKGATDALEFIVKRDVIKVRSVKAKMLEPGYGLVRITQFQEHTGENLVAAINDLYKQNGGELKGIVLDLRLNPGGLLNSAVAVSSAFLPRNSLVVYTDGRTEDAKMRLTATKENYVRGAFKEDYITKEPAAAKTVPLVVLVNGASASASEIVAGALQDHHRAVLIGTKSFGKGSVQTIIPLAGHGAMRLTTARYYTPSGRSIQARGIDPDIVVEAAKIAKEEKPGDKKDDKTAKAGDKKDDKSAKKDDKKGDKKDDSAADQGAVDPAVIGTADDYQLARAVDMLRGIALFNGRLVN